MSVSKNIPRHDSMGERDFHDIRLNTKTGMAEIHRVPSPMKLDPSWWPAVNARPTDGRKLARVQRRIAQAKRNREQREFDEYVASIPF